MVSFQISKSDEELVAKIVERYSQLAASRGHEMYDDVVGVSMDIIATIANGCTMNLALWLNSDEFDFIHDILGIANHLNRNTGHLENCFLPRCAR